MNKKLLLGILGVIFFCMVAHSEQNQENKNIFIVKDIKTFYDAGNLTDSIDIANDKAIVNGFKYLAYRMIPSSFKNRIYTIQEAEIIKTAKEVFPIKERMTNHSYMATVDIEYEPQKVKDLFNKYGIRYRTSYSEKILFIPIFDDEEIFLHRDWRWKWLNLDANFGLLNFNIFKKNISVSLENKYSTLFEPYYKFDHIIKDYNIKNLVIVFAELNKQQIEMTIRILNPQEDELKYLIVTKKFNESDQNFFNRYINELLDKFDSELKGIKSFDQNIIFTSKVKVNSYNPTLWSAIKNKLSNIKQLKSFRILTSTVDTMEIELNYVIPVQSFKEILSLNGLSLSKKSNEWFLALNNISQK